MKFRCFDFETTSADAKTCEVVQAALVDAIYTEGQPLKIGEGKSRLFYAAHIPSASTAVHGIRTEDVVDCPPFASVARKFGVSMMSSDVVIGVSYNGLGFDVPVLARYVAASGAVSRQFAETKLAHRHIDVMRLWKRYAMRNELAPWQVKVRLELAREHMMAEGFISPALISAPYLRAEMFSGKLIAAHGYFFGEGFDGAHDATVDCKATLRVLGEMLRLGVCDVETAIRWSAQPLPGDVDFEGKFKWDGDQAVLAIGDHRGTPIEDRKCHGFLKWMLTKDFRDDTKQVIRELFKGKYPARKYEDET